MPATKKPHRSPRVRVRSKVSRKEREAAEYRELLERTPMVKATIEILKNGKHVRDFEWFDSIASLVANINRDGAATGETARVKAEQPPAEIAGLLPDTTRSRPANPSDTPIADSAAKNFAVVLIDADGRHEVVAASVSRREAVTWVHEWLNDQAGLTIAVLPAGFKMPASLKVGKIVASEQQ